MERTNRIIDRTALEASVRRRVEELAKLALQDFMEGRFEATNRRLNEIAKALERGM